MASPQLSIILPSFRDARIIQAIESIRAFDDLDATKLVIVDGGSDESLLSQVRGTLSPTDVLISEPDRGIFDGLNKGLQLVDTEYAGWLGSDDLFTGLIRSSHVVAALRDCDIYVADLMIFRAQRVRRRTRSRPCALGLARFGLHNPHYSTFARSAVLKSRSFDLSLKGSDIDYFLSLFSEAPRVTSTSVVCTLQREGGFSTKSYRRIVEINRELWQVYRRHGNVLTATVAVVLKLLTKAASSLWYSLFPTSISRYLVADGKQSDVR